MDKGVISQERLKIKVKLLLTVLTGSHICSVDWHNNEWPWVTVNGRFCSARYLCGSWASCSIILYGRLKPAWCVSLDAEHAAFAQLYSFCTPTVFNRRLTQHGAVATVGRVCRLNLLPIKACDFRFCGHVSWSLPWVTSRKQSNKVPAEKIIERRLS